MTPLSQLLNQKRIEELKRLISKNQFPGVDLGSAMSFILSDGILPKSNLPISSFLKLEDWLRHAQPVLLFSASELKNKTGTILEKALQGHRVQILRHGRPIVEINAVE